MRLLIGLSFPAARLHLSRRLLSTAPAPPAPPKLKNLSYRLRARALAEARRALTDYLHCTRALPFAHAELIALRSPFSLSVLVSEVPFPPSASTADLPRALRRFLAYRPVDEFPFFLESIGLPPASSPAAAAHRGLFLSDDAPLLSALSALVHHGFPWVRLGLLYRENPTIFRSSPESLLARLRSFESLGLRRVAVIAVCLAFPSVLTADCCPGSETELLFQDLKVVFVDSGLDEFVGEGDNLDAFLKICKRIRVFYDAGSAEGKMGGLMRRNLRVFFHLDEASLAQKLGFFIRLGMDKRKVGIFLLECPEILDFDLEYTGISMPGYLRNIGLSNEEVASLSKRYPYVMGKNKLGNLPGSLRAMDLHEWFLAKIVEDGNHHYLTQDYAYIGSHDLTLEKDFLEDLERINSIKKYKYVANKLEFLLSIGFGGNKITTRALALINSTRDQLQERFDCLLELGIDYPMLCRIISATPKLLNQSAEMLHQKVNYLCNDLSYPLTYLDNFPAFLCFDLENRIKPRYRILNWLTENGLVKKPFSPSTVLANSEKRFIINLYEIHPAAPKQWLESFSSKSLWNGKQRNLF